MIDLAGAPVELATDRGVFSPDHLDPGTAFLLERAPAPPAEGDLLDLGCGYGPIAVALARRVPAATIWAADVNERARDLCRRNAAAQGCPNVRVVAPDEVPPDVRFAAIWSNPPIRIGKAALHALLAQWLDRLEPDGRATLVVSRNLGADSLHRWLEQRGHGVERIGSRRGYRLLLVTARPGAA